MKIIFEVKADSFVNAALVEAVLKKNEIKFTCRQDSKPKRFRIKKTAGSSAADRRI